MFFSVARTHDTPSNSEIICVQNVGAKVEMVSYLKNYREFLPYANFITANFITAVFQNYYKNLANAIFLLLRT